MVLSPATWFSTKSLIVLGFFTTLYSAYLYLAPAPSLLLNIQQLTVTPSNPAGIVIPSPTGNIAVSLAYGLFLAFISILSILLTRWGMPMKRLKKHG